MERAIFRQAAVDAQQHKLAGSALRSRPASLAVIAGFSFAAAALAVVYLFVGEYTRKEHVSGFVVPDKGLVRIYSPQNGTVVNAEAEEGRLVKQGAPLFTIRSEHNISEGGSAESAAIDLLVRRRDSLREELAAQEGLRSSGRRENAVNMQSIAEELAALNDQYALQQKRVEGARKVVARYRDLVASKFVSESQQQQQDLLTEQENRLKELQRSKIALERDAATSREQLTASGLRDQNQKSAIDRSIEEVEQQISEYQARRTAVVTSPGDGVVTALLVKAGQTVGSGTPLLSIIPSGSKMEAKLLVPTRAAGFIAVNQAVSLRYQAFPYQRFGTYRGRIVEIDKTILNPNDLSLPVPVPEPAYRVTVQLERQDVVAYGASMPLQAGMLLDADIAIERRRLIDWLFDPIYSVTGRL